MSIDWFMLLIILKFLPEFLQCGPHSAVSCLQNSLVVQWVRLHASNAAGAGLIPGQGTKIPYALSQKKKKKKKASCILGVNSLTEERKILTEERKLGKEG